MFRRSEDIFLDKLDIKVSTIIKKSLDKIDKGNCDKAFELLSPLIDQKNEAAIFYAASFGVSVESLEEVEIRRVKQLKQSSDLGYPPAIHDLAVLYDCGELVPRNIEKAAQLFKEAAIKGHPHSQWIHGFDLLYGRNNIIKNERLGLEYINKAADDKFEGALETLSEFYSTGRHGFPVDNDKAQYLKKRVNDKDIIRY